MTSQHPIAPPAELVQEWTEDWNCDESIKEPDVVIYVAAQAAQWGADTELEACCEWVSMETLESGVHLRAARRPKTLSLKEQALKALLHLDHGQNNERCLIIRRALEQLND